MSMELRELEEENERLSELATSAQKCAEEKTAMIVELHKQRDEIKRLREELHIANRRYGELLVEVEDKYTGQSRHDRALWVLRENKRVHAAYDAAIGAATNNEETI